MKEKLFANEEVNTGRQSEFDWAKSVAIIAMVVVHVYEIMGGIDVEVPPADPFRLILEFWAGPLAAPVFMFAMGVGIAYSRKSTPDIMAKRGLGLIKNGYLLSFFKGTILVIIGMLIGTDAGYTWQESFFMVSILQFAGMSFLFIALMKKWNFPLSAMMTVALLSSLAGTYLAQFTLAPWLQYIFGLLFVTNDTVSFPLMTWLFYPVAGLMFAYALRRVKNKKLFYKYCFIVGIIGLVITIAVYSAFGMDIRHMFQLAGRDHYNQTILHYIFNSFVILMFMSFYYLLSEAVKAEKIRTLVAFMGTNLNVIYIVQWLLVCYVWAVLVTLGKEPLMEGEILAMGLILLVAAVIITKIYLNAKKKRAAKKAAKVA